MYALHTFQDCGTSDIVDFPYGELAHSPQFNGKLLEARVLNLTHWQLTRTLSKYSFYPRV